MPKLTKPWEQMTAEEREALRAERRTERGGLECSQCGEEGYTDDMAQYKSKVYCEECYVEANPELIARILQAGKTIDADARAGKLHSFEEAFEDEEEHWHGAKKFPGAINDPRCSICRENK